jgi:hypothetical protein
MKTLGQVAYEAYCEFAQGASSITGVILPEWEQQNDRIKGAWQAAAEAAVKSFIEVKDDVRTEL